MFLIERLPKETEKTLIAENTSKSSLLEQKIISELALQQQRMWTPEFCNSFLIKHKLSDVYDVQSYFGKVLKIPETNRIESSDECLNYWKKILPPIHEQNSHLHIFSSLVATNDSLLNITYKDSNELRQLPEFINKLSKSHNIEKHTPISTNENNLSEQSVGLTNKENKLLLESPTTKINLELENLSEMLEQTVARKKENIDILNSMKLNIAENKKILKELKNEKKVHERINILLEDPKENIQKIESIILATIEKSRNIELQWKTHEKNLMEELNISKSKHAKEHVGY